jgi:hypothetical protein
MDHDPQQTSHQWGVFEQALVSSRGYENPLWDVTVRVELTSPSGRTQTIETFWDGGRDWRFRAAARTDDGAWTVVYAPAGGKIVLSTEGVKAGARARWFDPRSGHFRDAGPAAPVFQAPDDQDWILDLR